MLEIEEREKEMMTEWILKILIETWRAQNEPMNFKKSEPASFFFREQVSRVAE
jgi:hypothetical protein